MCYAV
jgi:hypothetical protein